MIYRNSPQTNEQDWTLDPNADAASIARAFLAGEYDLLNFTRARTHVVTELQAFLDATRNLPLIVYRSDSGDILVTARPSGESIHLTRRTADVLAGYLDNKVVRMEDRFDMTVRQAVRAI